MRAVSRVPAALEKAGIPTVSIIGSTFVQLSVFTGETNGVSGLPVASFPGALSVETAKSFREKLDGGVLDDIVAKLMGTVHETPSEVLRESQKNISFSGSLEDIYQVFSENQWTDGLPIIPPTIEKMEAFLQFTDRHPDEEVAILPPANLRATPRNIAANGVMAGCQPESMPLLLAIVEALGDRYFNLEHLGTTWGDIPFAVVNGPIAKQLGIQHGQGAVSLGANPVIGRFIGLIVRNVAGFKPGETYMGTWGYPLPFVFAENEEESPWEPYHVGKGFDRNTSTVTLGGTFNWGPQKSWNDVKSTDIGLDWLCDYAGKLIQAPKTWMTKINDMYTLLLTPPVARRIAESGFSKKGFIDYLWKNITISAGELHAKFLDGAIGKAGTIRYYLHKGGVDEETIKKYEALDAEGPDALFRQIVTPEEIHVFVTGDLGRDKMQFFWCWYNHPVTKEVKLPKNWGELTQNRCTTICSI